MENSPQLGQKYSNFGSNSEKKSFPKTLEEHSLSLRKKKNNRQRNYILPPELISDFSYKIDLSEIELRIKDNQLYIQFINSTSQKDSLSFLFQMLLIDSDDMIKFSISKIRDFLVNIDDKIFKEKNYMEEFNDKFIIFLFDLMFKKANDYSLLINISFILSKLAIFLTAKNNYFFEILLKNFSNILNLVKNIGTDEPKIKNLLYLLTEKIFLSSDDMIKNLEQNCPNYITQIHAEINNLDEKKFVKNMALISTLIQIINNCFFSHIYSNYFFAPMNNNSNNEINSENIIKFVQKLLNYSYQIEILELELSCIQNFLYFFMESEGLFSNKILKKKVQNMIYDLELEKKIVPMIYDSTVNEADLRRIAVQILINATYICPKKFCEKLVENNISEQITKLENFLISQTQFTNRLKHLYILLLDLIHNLIENESSDIIDNLTIENNCISLLFKLQKIHFYSKEIKPMIKIFNILISSNHKYIQTLLISEGICELYKSFLENEPSNDEIEIMINNFLSMVKYSENFMKEKNGDNMDHNSLLIHLEKIGVFEVVNNLKSRNELSNKVISAINEFCSLINHK